jgi:acetate kinase
MLILVLNCGSSSIKAKVLDSQTETCLLQAQVERVTEPQPLCQFDQQTLDCPASGHEAVLQWLLPKMQQHLGGRAIEGLGHRVAHGGGHFDQATVLDAKALEIIESLTPLAPLHNPAILKGIRTAQQIFPDLPHVGVFDTAFHQSLPKRSRLYALPKALREKHDLRRYGFHGTSHQYVAKLAADYLRTDIQQLRLITCHLGSGCSIAAIEYGRSIETSMGMTPLEGLVMGTRVGDVDAGLLIHLAKQEGWSLEQLDKVLNQDSGLKGLSGGSNDMRDIIQRATEGDEDCRMALQVFTHRLRKYIGAYAAVMGGVDAIVFTGGIGENSPVVRHRSCQRFDFLGALIDEDLNHDLVLSRAKPVQEFSSPQSRVKLLAIQTDEQLAIAKETAKLLGGSCKVNTLPAIPIAVSARHVHLTQAAVEQLFGAGYQLTIKNPLSQPGQYAANEQVTIVGPKNQLERVRILGPCRDLNQVEISRTDEFFLGVDAPVRASGKIDNTPGIKLVGPKGELTLTQGVICAWRHIHMSPEDAQIFGVQDKDIVSVEVHGTERPLTFGNVLIRVSPSFKLEMHIDTDEANAAELPPNAEGALMLTSGSATLLQKKL